MFAGAHCLLNVDIEENQDTYSAYVICVQCVLILSLSLTHTHTHTLTHTHTHTLSLSLSHTHTHTHSATRYTYEMTEVNTTRTTFTCRIASNMYWGYWGDMNGSDEQHVHTAQVHTACSLLPPVLHGSICSHAKRSSFLFSSCRGDDRYIPTTRHPALLQDSSYITRMRSVREQRAHALNSGVILDLEPCQFLLGELYYSVRVAKEDLCNRTRSRTRASALYGEVSIG